jgi:hypothetical protein
VPFRPPFRTTQIADLAPGDDGPSPDELVDFGAETTDAFVARTGSQAPAPLGAADAVPVFRPDLQIGKGASAGLFEVGDPATGRHFTLYEFELSIARMLDGRRHASDVIENGVRLGIPVDLDGLNKFVRQLWRYGFLAEPGAEPPAEAGEERGRGERVKWDEATRTLYQTGLRLMRQGRPQDAQSYFQAVLDADPGNAEATERLAAIERGETLAAGPIGARTARRAPDAPRRGKLRTIALAAAGIAAVAGAAAWFVTQRGWVAAPPPPPPVAAPAPAPPPPPRPAWRTAAVQRRAHPALGAVTAAGAGVVTWTKKDGAAVRQGERIGTLRTAAAGGAPAPIDPAAAARIKELEALAAQDPVYRDFLEKERRAAQRKRTVKGVREVKLVAPASGLLALAAANRVRVEAGAPLASVVDGAAWVVDAFVDGEPPPADAACELRGDAVEERLPCRLDAAEPVEGGSQLRLTVVAAAAPWLDRSRSLRVRVAPPGTAPEPGANRKEGTP